MGLGFAAVGIGTGAGLGQAIAAFQFTRGQAWYPFFLLFFIAVVEDGQGADASVGAEAYAECMRSPNGMIANTSVSMEFAMKSLTSSHATALASVDAVANTFNAELRYTVGYSWHGSG